MTTGTKWMPPHRRRGSSVRAHKRSNGTFVKAHFRGDHFVRGHYASYSSQLPLHDATTPPRDTKNKSLDLALEQQQQLPGLPTTSQHPPSVTAVLWTDAIGKTRLGRDNISVPPDAVAVTIMARTNQGKNITLEADTFYSADGTVWHKPASETNRP